jgi:signal transduction histidine kinase
MENPKPLPADAVRRLRALTHDLSNSLETILQAAYLLGQVELEAQAKHWVQMIDSATQDGARINHQIREVLRSQG